MKKTIAAGIFLVRIDGTILICHPTNHKADFWSIPKGKLDDGETTFDAAIRETFEETNINLSSASLIDLPAVAYNHNKKVLNPFICFEKENKDLNWDGFDIKCNSNVPIERGGFPEMDAYKWVPILEARNLLHNTQVACLDTIEKYYNELRD